MDVGDGSLPDGINPNNFPAKLWRLVNNPANEAICWDCAGEIIVIEQQLFERQVLSPATSACPDNADAFKTTNFSSFVRQLNLYGFRKADPVIKDSRRSGGGGAGAGTRHHFFNPNFKRNQPELVAKLRRLTVDNKAKMQAGLSVSCRPPNRYQRHGGSDDGREKSMKRGTSLLSPSHQESTHPYYPHKAQATTVHNGTPVPPRYLIRGHGAALSPPVFAADKGMPLPLSHRYAGVAPGSSPMHVQRGLLVRGNHGNSNFPGFNPRTAQYQPGYSSPVFQYYHPNLLASHMTGSGLQPGPYPLHSYYQAGYPVNMFCHSEHNQDSQSKEDQEIKKCNINLDTVFQIADEVMQTPLSNTLVKVVTPEKPGPLSEPSSSTRSAAPCNSPASTAKTNTVCSGPTIIAVSGNVELITSGQQEESVIIIPEQMPEDAIFEVTSDDDTECAGAKGCDSHLDPSQANSSSCRSTSSDL